MHGKLVCKAPNYVKELKNAFTEKLDARTPAVARPSLLEGQDQRAAEDAGRTDAAPADVARGESAASESAGPGTGSRAAAPTVVVKKKRIAVRPTWARFGSIAPHWPRPRAARALRQKRFKLSRRASARACRALHLLWYSVSRARLSGVTCRLVLQQVGLPTGKRFSFSANGGGRVGSVMLGAFGC